MKKPSSDIHQLIMSMSKAEKGYFRRHSSIDTKGSNTSYNLLYDAIHSQKIYDEKKLIAQFKDRPFVRQFPVAKSYLYYRILTSLDSYHDSGYETMRSYLHHIEILFDKGLYSHSLKLVKKAKKEAFKIDMLFYLPEILQWEREIASQAHDYDWMQRTNVEFRHVLHLLENIQTFHELSVIAGGFIWKYGEEKKAGYFNKVKKLMRHPVLRRESNALSFSAQLSYCYMYAYFYYLQENYAKANDFYQKEFDLYRQNPDKIKYHFRSYIACTNNLLAACYKSKNYAAFKEPLETLKKALASEKNEHFRARLFFAYTNYSLDHILLAGEFNKAEKIIQETLRDFAKYENKLSQNEKTIIYSNVAVIWFGNEEFKKCIYYLNKIRNEFTLHIHPDVERFLNLFYLVVHYELGHYDLLPRLSSSVYRLLEKQERTSKFEKIVLVFFAAKSMQNDSRKEQLKAFSQLKRELLPLTSDQEEKQSFQFFDYIMWINSKLENKTFAEIIKDRVNKK